jgi:aspartate/methionine/tyrosine aminotransferase
MLDDGVVRWPWSSSLGLAVGRVRYGPMLVAEGNSFSKTYAMTGWRVGYIAAPGDVALQFLKYHHTVNICAAAFAQRACIAALEGPQNCVSKMIEEYDRRRARIVERVNQIPRLSCITPRGAFYIFVNIKQLAMPSSSSPGIWFRRQVL